LIESRGTGNLKDYRKKKAGLFMADVVNSSDPFYSLCESLPLGPPANEVETSLPDLREVSSVTMPAL
jgi:hypothetical protein